MTAAPTPGPPRVLLVDDDEDSAEMLGLLLTRRGFEVTIARSVASAVEAAAAAPVDVLLSDIGLPDGTGHDLLARLRSMGPLPAVALSGLDHSSGARGRSGGEAFDEYLGKPVAIDQLVNALHRAAARARV
jgi:CheY-like chemotaxis protein